MAISVLPIFFGGYANVTLPAAPATDTAGYLEQARKLASEKKWWNAIEILTRAVETSSAEDLKSQSYLERAKAFLEVGATGWAYHDLNRAKKIRPEDSAIPFLMGKLFLVQRDYLEAENEFDKALQGRPYDPEYLTERIKAYLGLERFQDVLKDVQTLGYFHALSEKIRTYAAQAYLGLGKDQNALEELNQAIQLNQRSFEARRMRAHLWNKLGRRREATRDLLSAVRHNDLLRALSSRKGRLRIQIPLNYKEELEKTLRDLDLLLELKPDFSRAYILKSKVLLALKLPLEAIDILENIPDSDPLSAEAYLLRGKAYRALMQNKAALDSLSEAFKRDPHNPEVSIEKCFIFLSEGDLENASLEIEKIRQEDPSNPFLFELEGIEQLMRGEDERANTYFMRFHRLVQSPWDKTGFSNFHGAKTAYRQHRNFQRFLRDSAGYPARLLYPLNPSESMVDRIFKKIDFAERFKELRSFQSLFPEDSLDANLLAPFLTEVNLRSRLEKTVERERDPGTSREASVLIQLVQGGKFKELTFREKELFLRAFVLNAPVWKYKGEFMTLISLLQQIHLGERWSSRGKTRKTVGFYVVPSKKLYAQEKDNWIVETGAYYSGSMESVYIKDEAIPTLREAFFISLHELAHWITVQKGLLYRSGDVHMISEGLANELSFSTMKLLDEIYPGRGYDYLALEEWLRYYWFGGAFPYTLGQVFSEIIHEEAGSSWPGVLKEVIRNPKTFFQRIGLEESHLRKEQSRV